MIVKFTYLAFAALMFASTGTVRADEDTRGADDLKNSLAGQVLAIDKFFKFHGFKNFETDLEDPEIAGLGANWTEIRGTTATCLREVALLQKAGASDAKIEWPKEDDSSKGMVSLTAEEVKTVCTALNEAIEKVSKKNCYVFNAVLHEKATNEYFLLNKSVDKCPHSELEGVNCGPEPELSTVNQFKVTRIDCAKVPKENELGKAFKSLDDGWQKGIWRTNTCLEKAGGVTRAPASNLESVILKEGEFNGKNKFRTLELTCYHHGIPYAKAN
jgi:hypothetical protein